MTDTTTAAPVAEQPKIPLSQVLVAYAAIDHASKAADDAAKTARAVVAERVRQRFLDPDEPAKSTPVMHDGQKLGVVTAKESQDAYVVADELELMEWLEENNPNAIETVRKIRDADKKVLLNPKHLTVVDDVVYDTRTGEPLPGVKFKAGGAVTGFTFTGRNIEALDRLVQDDVIGALVDRAAVTSGATIAGEVLEAGQ